jgi:DNA-binding NtrC family response regulator
VPFNCTAVAPEMLASQLFGHRRAAFTGADDNVPGVIRSAANGTVFLDEIGELSLDLQPKLLRFIETSEVHPLGEGRPVKVNVRIVAATNAPLEELVKQGRFRQDLFYRLNVMRLAVPPLRERREEIPLLTEHFIERNARELRKFNVHVSDEAMEYLVLFRWPGNIRQLQNEVRRIMALAQPGMTIVPTMLSPEILHARKTVDADAQVVRSNEFVVRIDQTLDEAVDAVERFMIDRALTAERGHLEGAARRLGISRKGLFLKRRRLGLAS